MARRVNFSNGNAVTAGHLKVALQIIGGMLMVLVGVLSFIYVDFVQRQDIRDSKQDIQQTKYHNELILIGATNSVTIQIIKEHIEKRDSVNLDPLINDRFKMKHSNTRGAKLASRIFK